MWSLFLCQKISVFVENKDIFAKGIEIKAQIKHYNIIFSLFICLT